MSRVLCIDLDGTLIYTDSLQEAIVCFIKSNPLRVWLLLVWLCRGRAYLKQQLGRRVSLDPSLLPYNQALLQWMRECKNKGQTLVLATATDRCFADAVADYLGIFDEVLASDGQINLRSKNKAMALNHRYGTKGYDYAGNSHADMAVWQEADQAIVVNASTRLLRQVKKRAAVSKIFARQPFSFKAFLKMIRVHQYAKNGLIFVPIFAGHLVLNGGILCATLLGFFSFCLMASSVYLLNDLFDLFSDRMHPTKSKRAIASGLLSIPKAALLAAVFWGGAVGFAWCLPESFQGILLFYFLLTLGYSLQLKQMVLIDVITLSILYTTRIVAGIVLLASGGSFGCSCGRLCAEKIVS